MKKLLKDVGDFHFVCEVEENKTLNQISTKKRKLRIDLLKEEVKEYIEAEIDNDPIEIADALADIIYIAVGTARIYWIPLDKVWAEVQRSNMDKIDPKTGKVIKRADGKILKPEWWEWPRIAEIINKK